MEQEVGGSSPPNCTSAAFRRIRRASVPAPARRFEANVTTAIPSLPISRRSPTISRSSRSSSIARFQFGSFGGRMILVRSGQPGLLLAIALSTALLSGTARAYTPEQQQACTPDAFRLCGDAIPDVDRVTVCMIRNQAQLSPACRAFFRAPEPERAPVVTPVTARKPVRLTPVTARRPVSVKPKKSKKSRQAR